jgi:putative glutamine amidotransferase
VTASPISAILMTTRLLVAVTATSRETEGIQRVRLNQSYVRALEGAGLLPLVVPPLDDADAARTILASVHGLVLTGGEDVHPARYGAEPHPATNPANPRRDAGELAFAEAARLLSRPTLAICRGIQVVNVALGGSLVQDITSQMPNALRHDADAPRQARVHDVRVERDTVLARSLAAESIRVNSSHHQAVERLAPGLRLSAMAPDGVIEAAEWHGADWWMVGVQWHPEELVDTPEPWDRRLFAAFAAACAGRTRHEAAATR